MRQDIKSIIEWSIGGNPDGFRVTSTTTGQVFQGSDLVPAGRYFYEWKMDRWQDGGMDFPEWLEGDFQFSITPLGELVDHADEIIGSIEDAMLIQMNRELAEKNTKGIINFADIVKNMKNMKG